MFIKEHYLNYWVQFVESKKTSKKYPFICLTNEQSFRRKPLVLRVRANISWTSLSKSLDHPALGITGVSA